VSRFHTGENPWFIVGFTSSNYKNNTKDHTHE